MSELEIYDFGILTTDLGESSSNSVTANKVLVKKRDKYQFKALIAMKLALFIYPAFKSRGNSHISTTFAMRKWKQLWTKV